MLLSATKHNSQVFFKTQFVHSKIFLRQLGYQHVSIYEIGLCGLMTVQVLRVLPFTSLYNIFIALLKEQSTSLLPKDFDVTLLYYSHWQRKEKAYARLKREVRKLQQNNFSIVMFDCFKYLISMVITHLLKHQL